MKNSTAVLKKLKIKLPCDPAISLMCLQSKELKVVSPNDICTSSLITALLTLAKIWKQNKCPLTDEGIKKMWLLCLCVHAQPPLITTYAYNILKSLIIQFIHNFVSIIFFYFVFYFLNLFLLSSFPLSFALLQISKPSQACLLSLMLSPYITVPHGK